MTPVTTKLSSRSVSETLAILTDVVTTKGLKVFGLVDHSGEAANIGQQLRNTKLLIFGSPLQGTRAMVEVPLVALDLPLKVLVWDDNGQTKVSYTPPSELAARYGLSDELAARLAGIEAITDAAVS
jgi:uncharacterized protein (DUF302 family)